MSALFRRPSLALLGGLWLLSPPAGAEPGLHGLVRTTSDYLVRGYSKSDDEAAVQANLDYSRADGLYLGGWLSQVDFGGAEVEGIAYLGVRRPLATGWWVDLSVSQYAYESTVFGRQGDYAALYASLSLRDRATVGFGFSPDPYGFGHPTGHVQVEGRHAFTDTLEASAGVGFERARAAYDYDNVYWEAGVSWFPGSCFAVDLRYHGARQVHERAHEDDPAGDIGDTAFRDRVVLSLSCGR
ncbi:MAG TPA: TorF family putative porin [Nevskiaceae bacterium]|nr:TorF family putative porin [Nevskiaceae bacterium]